MIFKDKLFWIVFIFVVLGAILATLFTFSGTKSTWYSKLNKAPWNPPSWVFSVVWTLIYILTIFVGYLGISYTQNISFTVLFIIAMLVNIAWCAAFFFFQSIEVGMFLLLVLDVLVLAQIVLLYVLKANLPASLLLPYLVWGIFAATLNGYILAKN